MLKDSLSAEIALSAENEDFISAETDHYHKLSFLLHSLNIYLFIPPL